jgi:hypothetical protein
MSAEVPRSAAVADDEACPVCGEEMTEDDEAVGVYPRFQVDDLASEPAHEEVDWDVVLIVHRRCFDPARYVEAE